MGTISNLCRGFIENLDQIIHFDIILITHNYNLHLILRITYFGEKQRNSRNQEYERESGIQSIVSTALIHAFHL